MTRHRARTLASVAAALDTVVELGPGRLDDASVGQTLALRQQLDERMARGAAVTVAALAGGTGVGKSALVNALLGRPVATEGVRRPTTAVPLAAVHASSPEVTALLDWLAVPERHAVGEALPDGLVLLDLPDHDSVEDAHRATAARLAQRVDVVVWVVDPLKYSRDDTHHGPLAQLTAHADVLLVALNHADELASQDVATCVRDLEARLADGGHDDARIVVTSATTGEGVAELRAALTDLATRRTAAAARLAADAAVVGDRLHDRLDPLPAIDVRADAVVDDVLVAVDGHRAAAEAAGLYRREAARQCRSPMARLVGAPVRALTGGLRRTASAPAEPPPRAATVEAIEAALRGALEIGATVGQTHAALDRAVGTAADRAAPVLSDAVASADLVPRRRRWWAWVRTLRLLTELTAVVGAGWLTALAVVAWLQLPALPTPDAVGELSWPTTLLAVGILARLLAGGVTRAVARVGARRHATRVRRQIARRVRDVVDDQLLGPVRQELADQRRLRNAVATLREGPGPHRRP